MQSTDFGVVLAAEFILAGLSFVSFAMRVRLRLRKATEASVDVRRGEQSMNSLYVIYGIVTVVYSLLVQVAEAFEGHKALLIALNYVALTYLFFFSSWFRNKIFFPVMERVRHD
jgi:hypothetical protein